MSSINVDQETKDLFDELQPDDATQAEFVQTLLETYQRDVDGIVIDEDAIAEQIERKVGTKIEQYAYQGVKEALERYE